MVVKDTKGNALKIGASKNYITLPDWTKLPLDAVEKYHEIQKELLYQTIKKHLELLKETNTKLGLWEHYKLNLDELCFEKAELTEEVAHGDPKKVYSIPYKDGKSIEVTALFEENDEVHKALVMYIDSDGVHSTYCVLSTDYKCEKNNKTEQKLWEILWGHNQYEIKTLLKKKYPDIELSTEL